MDRSGEWRLSPAYDVVYAFNPAGTWTSRHQMTITGKSDGFVRRDFHQLGKLAGLERARVDEMIDHAIGLACDWERFAQAAGVPDNLSRGARAGFRTRFAVT